MVGKVLQIADLVDPDDIGVHIANKWVEWNGRRQHKISEWQELKRYLYATNTRHTTNNKLPWSNTTTLPKLTQIRDNLFANYIATMFPKRRWMKWEGMSNSDENPEKTKKLIDYIMWAVSQTQFKEEVKKLVLDYIDYGNCIGTVEWVDESSEDPDTRIKLGFVGPRPRRIAPNDIVFNPTAPSFSNSPKIYRTLMSLGEAHELLQRLSATEEDRVLAKSVIDYCIGIRNGLASTTGAVVQGPDFYNVDGFDSFNAYLESDYVELITFCGDLYDRGTNTLRKNHLVVVIDRHKVALERPYPYPMAEIPMYHAGWRVRQDNLWAMGPLDNLVGMQYRLDHIENMKADVLDLVTYPPLLIKGSGAIGDFEWGPMERIYMDGDGDVQLKSPDVNALQTNLEITSIEARMEEMAGSPKEAMGFRTPGEKTAYEVQRLENAASRIFQNKIAQFEEQIIEPLLNAMLVLAKENLVTQSIRIIDEEFGGVDFSDISRDDLSANGRIKPVAARHFAEQAELIQNLTSLSSSPIFNIIAPHISSVKLSEMIEDALNLQDYDLVQPYVQISERAEAQKLQMAAQEQAMMEAQAPTGLTPDDYSEGADLSALEGEPDEADSAAGMVPASQGAGGEGELDLGL